MSNYDALATTNKTLVLKAMDRATSLKIVCGTSFQAFKPSSTSCTFTSISGFACLPRLQGALLAIES